jgi:hypothetical protein
MSAKSPGPHFPSHHSVFNFRQRVLDADPNWHEDSLRPWVYEFSNGRRFYQPTDPYQGGYKPPDPFILDRSDLDGEDVMG